ncbi:UNVERIFIED_CONTAM: hypothetical protein NCL1_03564 [Trichonephila clavipes]
MARMYCVTRTTRYHRVGTIHSRGHSMENPLENQIVHPSVMTSIRILLTCPCKILCQSVCLEYFAPDIYRPAYSILNFKSTSRIIQQPEKDPLFIVYSITCTSVTFSLFLHVMSYSNFGSYKPNKYAFYIYY